MSAFGQKRTLAYGEPRKWLRLEAIPNQQAVYVRKIPTVITFVLALSGCSREEPVPENVSHSYTITDVYAKYGCTRMPSNPAMVTIEELLDSPNRYEGKPVRIEGFYYSTFEHAAIYPNPEDGPHSKTQSGLWVLEGLPKRYSGKHVTVEGIFTSGTHGHLGQWPATICNARGYSPH